MGCTLLFVGTLGWAQGPTNAKRDAAEQRRAQERETQLRDQQERTPDVRLPVPAAAPPQRLPASEAPCFTIHQIELRGDASDHFGWLPGALAGPQGNDAPRGKCLGARGVKLVLERAQNALVAKGYVTSRVLAEPQDLSTGRLVLTLIPGRIHAIRFVEPVDPRGTAWNAVPAQAGDLLNLRDIEQALENFKRVPSAEADIQIAPATGDAARPGESDLLISYRQGVPFRLALSADDSGTRGTGKYQGGITLSYDNWWTLNDLFYVSLNHDLDRNLGGSDAGPRGTQGGTVHYSVPLGYWLLGATVSSNRYFQTVAGASQDYIFSGTSRNAELKLSRLLYRDASRKTTASIKAFQRRSNNFIDDTEVQVQRRVVGGWELGIGHKEFIGAAVLEGNLAYKRGTGAFGSLQAPEEAFGEGSSRFALVSADAGLNLPFKLADRRWRYSANWRAQFDRTPLTPQDRFAIGGRYSVRGFDGEQVLSGERGWLIRNEIGAPWGDGGQEFYVGLDHGQVSGPSSAWLVGRSLTGAVLGLRGGIRNLQYDLFIGAPVRKPAGLHTTGSVAGFNLNLSF
ncbi:ShlB/FhaC/HecB family hemolysin secretion/activation protein [Polaromonas sp. C04]|uniref:ShlB/FhaC/HecB family hemolysin secretion/activation protein n=1 Tax=Polaromonas sp. C04 TaxID=1945857 RepID=UPI0011860DD7|nr:ShlB/FhaC/HecB family hemolysin secretion/activation protein [Polaromonas sp. C04]